MIVPPGRSRPSRSAASTSRIATRSLIEPPGLKYSSFATSCGLTPAPMRLSRTSGVSPTVSRIESLMSAWEPVADELIRLTIGNGAPRRDMRVDPINSPVVRAHHRCEISSQFADGFPAAWGLLRAGFR